MADKKKRFFRSLLADLLIASMMLTACGKASDENAGNSEQSVMEDQENSENTATGEKQNDTANSETEAPEIPGLTFESEMELTYAEIFRVYNYEDGYSLIDIKDGDRYLVVPEGKEAPEGLDESIIVIAKPLKNIYLAATSAMALFSAVDALDVIRMSGQQASGWYVDKAVEAMNSGDMIFAGKYNEPDYELLLDHNCDLAIESTMIYHSPKVKEMVEDLDIPVFVDRSSYESHPLGRTEWIKLYGVLVDKVPEATAFFEEQEKIIEDLKDFKNTGKTIAFFYVNSDGSVVVRRPEDYIPKMMEIAGGEYVLSDLKTDSNNASVSITMEEFYASAVDADYLVYNGTIDNAITSIDELCAKSELFRDFKAVKEGNVWTTNKALYQATDIVGRLITDFHLMIIDGDESEMTFLTKVKE